MKLLVAGYGSIGRVHAANARVHAEVAVLDENPDAAAAARAAGFSSVFTDDEVAFRWGADGVIVATPPATHLNLAAEALHAGAHVLIEKPVTDDWAGVGAFLDTASRSGRAVHVVCNMRFHPAIAAMTRHLGKTGQPLFARAHYGHYLPNMRPGADYRTFYSARRAGGGGVIRDAIHEIDYLVAWFGPVRDVSCDAARLGSLNIDVEDYATISLRHESGVRSEIHLDYLRHRKRRGCEVCGTDASLVWESHGRDPEHCRVALEWRNDAEAETLLEAAGLDGSSMYRDLMSEFVRAVRGEPAALATARDGADALGVALAALRSAQLGQHVAAVRAAA